MTLPLGQPVQISRSAAVRAKLARRPRLLGARGELVVGRVADLDEGETLGGHHLERAGARARHPAARPPSAGVAATHAPTSARTMLWQNASACSRATQHAVVVARPGRTSCSVRIVGRTLARPAEAREVVQARAGSARHPASRRSSRAAGYQSVWVRRRGSCAGGGVGDAVLVPAPEGGEAGVEARRGDGATRFTRTSDSSPAMPLRRAWRAQVAAPLRCGRASLQLRGVRSTCATWPIACTPTSVRPATTSRGARAAAAEDRGERLLELALHGAHGRAGAPSRRTSVPSYARSRRMRPESGSPLSTRRV